MTLLITVNKNICNAVFIYVISKVIITTVFIDIVTVPFCKYFSNFFEAAIKTFEIHFSC
jgi:hypothetical protein